MHRRSDCTDGQIAQEAALHMRPYCTRAAASHHRSEHLPPAGQSPARPQGRCQCRAAVLGLRKAQGSIMRVRQNIFFFTPAHVCRHLLGMCHAAPLESSRRGGQNEYGHIHNRAPPGQCFSECFTCAMWPHVRCGDWPHVCHGAAEDLRLDRAGTPIRIHAYGHV